MMLSLLCSELSIQRAPFSERFEGVEVHIAVGVFTRVYFETAEKGTGYLNQNPWAVR